MRYEAARDRSTNSAGCYARAESLTASDDTSGRTARQAKSAQRSFRIRCSKFHFGPQTTRGFLVKLRGLEHTDHSRDQRRIPRD